MGLAGATSKKRIGLGVCRQPIMVVHLYSLDIQMYNDDWLMTDPSPIVELEKGAIGSEARRHHISFESTKRSTLRTVRGKARNAKPSKTGAYDKVCIALLGRDSVLLYFFGYHQHTTSFFSTCSVKGCWQRRTEPYSTGSHMWKPCVLAFAGVQYGAEVGAGDSWTRVLYHLQD
jgi:hypothetical protein